MIEEWRDVIGYEGVYQVSNTGRVRSLDRVTFNPRINKLVKVNGRLLKPAVDKDGYLQYNLLKKTHKAHRLVLCHFGPQAGEGETECDHINGKRDDNRIENLRWSTVSHNRFNLHGDPRSNSGHRGVSWCKQKRKFRAYITKDKKPKTLGWFDDPLEAVSCRACAETLYFGSSI